MTTLLSRIVGTLLTGNHSPQSGDAYARLGAPAGASVSADIVAINAKTTNLPASPSATGAKMDIVDVPNATAVTAIQNGLATPTNITAGTITTVTTLTNAPSDSSGVTTLLTRLSAARAGYLDVLNGIVAAIWANVDRTLTSFGFTFAITPPADMALNSTVAKEATKLTAAQVWNALTSGLTTVGSVGKWILDKLDVAVSSVAGNITINNSVAVSSVQAAAASSGSLGILAGYTFRATVYSTSTADLNSATKLWFAFKQFTSEPDSSSLVFIEKTAGLTVLNRAAIASPIVITDGSLTISGSSGAWVIDIFINEPATAVLFGANVSHGVAGVKALVAGDTVDVWHDPNNASIITDGVVRAIS